MTSSKSTFDHGPGEPGDDYFSSASSERSHSDDAQWESLLDRGLAYGIKTRDQLRFEADVGHTSLIGCRLVDNPSHRHEIELWEILLIAQALQNGHEGIKAIWRGMKFRGEAIRFEGDDPRIEGLWKTFLSAGSEDHHFLWSICKEAKHLKYKRPNLFAEIVGAALEGSRPLEAYQFASFIGQKHYKGREDLLATFFAACRSKETNSLKGFCSVYDLVPKTRIYAEVTSSLWAQDRSSDAFMMHSFLIARKDLPPRFELLEPYINYLALHNESLERFLSPLNQAGASFEAQARRLWSIGRSRITGIPADSLNIVASKTMGSAPTKLSDQFVARAFATRAFSFDFAVNSLRMIGLIEVGPLAVRQMVLAARDLATLQARFQKLRELEIDTGSSVFVRIIRDVCDAGHWEMVQALVDNDLHHEVFEDIELQSRLLTEYYRTKDWRQLNRTLVILNDGQFDNYSRGRSANLLLRAMMDVGDWRGAVNCVSTLQEHGLHISSSFPESIITLFRANKSSAGGQGRGDIDKIGFLIGLMQNVLASGTNFKIRLWRAPVKALGRQGRLKELESLVYWVAEWYRNGGLNGRVLQVPMSGSGTNLNVLFDDKFQKSLMSWCFRPRKGMGVVSPERCLWWTRVLKRLRDVYGVEVKEYVIRWEFIYRLRRLFASGMRLKAPNAWMRSRNRTSLAQYWALYDKMWDMKPAGQVKYDDRNKASLYHRKLSPLKRRRLISHWLRRRADRALGRGTQGGFGQSTGQEGIVVYRDLFNASWEDYRK
ncbi:uncharacterized protein A1O5_06399 [Cladophialophora psammophila CBS 110553]|uniref:Pentatricopeptide repeat domain-containing protein n=1 Tax=Cladophialophora psammophila CBS 110553 TaxID=1182543 RepID=W9X098_9EURO|nr:uncharacterized protein A1O5_06399 [Cladophialophora psammophila CBS 110553]EXJ70331.1 hypothetical protein A1O5_06399 [Cladophialophora psammophila CBS 110553]